MMTSAQEERIARMTAVSSTPRTDAASDVEKLLDQPDLTSDNESRLDAARLTATALSRIATAISEQTRTHQRLFQLWWDVQNRH